MTPTWFTLAGIDVPEWPRKNAGTVVVMVETTLSESFQATKPRIQPTPRRFLGCPETEQMEWIACMPLSYEITWRTQISLARPSA